MDFINWFRNRGVACAIFKESKHFLFFTSLYLKLTNNTFIRDLSCSDVPSKINLVYVSRLLLSNLSNQSKCKIILSSMSHLKNSHSFTRNYSVTISQVFRCFWVVRKVEIRIGPVLSRLFV